MNELEGAVDRLLKSANLRDAADDALPDNLSSKDHTIEDVKARRAELRKARELLHRAQVKANRVSKIKSKTYRKIKRKSDAKLEGELMGMEVDEEEERLKHEAERAKERATLRHKSGSKWMRSAAKSFGDDGGDKKKSIEAALRISEDLRRKVAGNEESGNESDGSMEDVSEIKARAAQELAELSDGEEPLPTEGVYGMKFMRDAMARQLDRVNREVDDFRQELQGPGEDSDTEISLDANGGVMSLNVGGNKGRFVYQPSASSVGTFTPCVDKPCSTSAADSPIATYATSSSAQSAHTTQHFNDGSPDHEREGSI